MADALTSKTGSVTANVVTFLVPGKKDGVFLMVKYNKGTGTSVSLQPTLIAPHLHATDEYKPIYLDADAITVQPQSFKFTANGNYRIPISVGGGEKKLKITPTFVGGTDDQAVVADIIIE
jgi:hypothetical protein